MIKRLKSNIVRNIGPLGGYQIAKYLTRNKPRILMYHRFNQNSEHMKVSAASFEKQIAYLKKHFNVVALPEIFTLIMQGNSLPPDSIVLTIDDGYRDFYEVAYPILKKYEMTATLYVTTGFIDGNIWLWPDKIEFILENTLHHLLRVDINGTSEQVMLRNKEDKNAAWLKMVDYCISLPVTERNNFISVLADNSDIGLEQKPPVEYAAMSWKQIRELSDYGINIGAHTQTHPILSKINVDHIEDEINGSKQKIEKMINKPVSCFCYPNGELSDFTPIVKEKVKKSGFLNATVAFDDGAGWEDPYEIRRHSVGNGMFQFYKAVNGVEIISHYYRRG